MRLVFLCPLFIVVVVQIGLAELPSVRFDRLTPLGGAAGTAVDVEIAGADLEEVDSLLFDHPGLRAEPVKDKQRQFSVSIAADTPAGTYDVRLVGKYGVSNPRLFAVSRGLKDIAEVEPNNEASQAQRVTVNSTVNGMSDGNGEDVFRFAATKGQRVTIECQAGKLDSMMDATLTLHSAGGAQLAASGDYAGRDPLVDFLAADDGDYLVTVSDLSFRGGFPYRLTISDRPQVENVFPRAIQAGQPVDLTVLGRNLGSGSTPSTMTISDLPLDEFRLRVTPPTDVLPLAAFRFLEHPTDHSVLPTAATCTLSGYQLRATTGDEALNAQTLMLVDGPVTLEVEPNNEQDKPQAIQLPAIVSGRFDHPRDADWFEFDVTEAGQYAFDVYCERIAGRADPYLVVADDQGNRVTELDDYGHRVKAFDGHLRDPSGMVNLAANRKYRVLVQDRYRRGGARYQYVLTIRKPVPDFFAAVIHSQNPGPGGATVWRGGASYLDVVIHQREGYNGPITIVAEGLPPGLHAAPTTVNNNNSGTFVVWADEDAPEWTGTIKLFAMGRQGDATFRREVRPYTRVWSDAGMNSSRPTRELAVAIRDTAPYSLNFTSDRIEVEAGKNAELKLQLARRWPDFKNSVNVLPLSFPGNFKMANADVAVDQTEINVTIEVQNNTRPGDYTLAVLGQSQVPFSKDAQAANRPNTLVSLPSRPLTIAVVEPTK